METKSSLLHKAAALRDRAERARALALGLNADDAARIRAYSEELRDQAAEVEKQAAAVVPRRPAEEGHDSDDNPTAHSQKKPGGSNDPDPQR